MFRRLHGISEGMVNEKCTENAFYSWRHESMRVTSVHGIHVFWAIVFITAFIQQWSSKMRKS